MPFHSHIVWTGDRRVSVTLLVSSESLRVLLFYYQVNYVFCVFKQMLTKPVPYLNGNTIQPIYKIRLTSRVQQISLYY